MSNFDQIIKQRLESLEYGQGFDASMWQAIEAELASPAPVSQPSPGNFQQGLIGGIAAAVTLGVLFTSLPSIQDAPFLPETPTVDREMPISVQSPDMSPTTTENAVAQSENSTSHATDGSTANDNHVAPSTNSETQVYKWTATNTVGTANEAGGESESEHPVSPSNNDTHNNASTAYNTRVEACAGAVNVFTLPATLQSGFVSWMVDKKTVANGLTFQRTFEDQGSHVVEAFRDGMKIASFDVEVLGTPDATIFPATIEPNDQCFESQVVLSTNIQPDVAYGWKVTGQPAGTGNTVTITRPVGSYNVELTATDKKGCKGTSTRMIDVTEGFSIYAPKAFSPNGDGKNDLWIPVNADQCPQVQLVIRSLSGVEVYSTTSHPAWDGTLPDGGKARVGENYVYTLVVRDACGTLRNIAGNITISQFD